MATASFHVDNHTALDFAVAHFLENGVGFVQAAQLHHGHHDAFGAELEGFFQVFARTHQRADNFHLYSLQRIPGISPPNQLAPQPSEKRA